MFLANIPFTMPKTFSTAEVAKHNKTTDLYIVVDEDVYDLTKFQDEHPGGKKSKQDLTDVSG